jgi:hypothetical protein
MSPFRFAQESLFMRKTQQHGHKPFQKILARNPFQKRLERKPSLVGDKPAQTFQKKV